MSADRRNLAQAARLDVALTRPANIHQNLRPVAPALRASVVMGIRAVISYDLSSVVILWELCWVVVAADKVDSTQRERSAQGDCAYFLRVPGRSLSKWFSTRGLRRRKKIVAHSKKEGK